MSSKQAVVQQIFYPTSAKFNLDYYLTNHWPLVEKLWGPQGLLNWTVTTGGKDTGYSVQATLVWESLEAFENLQKVDEVMGDIPNFSDNAPTQWIGKVVGRGTITK